MAKKSAEKKDNSRLDLSERVFDARPDSLDFRDRMYEATLVEVPTRIPLEDYLAYETPVLDQGVEGACTGFGLATVANHLLRRRKVDPETGPVSPRMIYEMAKRYDEYPGEDYQGSSARGAMKAWHKHGVCSEELWPYRLHVQDNALTNERVLNASRRPLGAYLRVNHRNLVAMHSALAEVGILFASANVHPGWLQPAADGVIPYEPGIKPVGGHAFAIVAYDENGFWLQNSWSARWGRGGFAQITYDDWLANGMDVWAARLGAPVVLRSTAATAAASASRNKNMVSYAYSDLRPHIVSVGNNGLLLAEGTYGSSESDLAEIFRQDMPRVMQGWQKKRLLLYAHGGLVNPATFVQRLAEYRAVFLPAEVYPLAFIWHTDLWTTITNILQDAFSRRRPEGTLSANLDFLLNRLDDTLEPLVRSLSGKAIWEELKENANLATTNPKGGARLLLKYLAEWAGNNPDYEIHLLAHSAGSIFLAPLARLLTAQGKISAGLLRGAEGYGLPVTSCTMWAPAQRLFDFKRTYLPAIQNGAIHHFALYTLTDEYEQNDHCAHIYNKSLLYMVANALEEHLHEPVLGLEKSILSDVQIAQMFGQGVMEWVRAPNTAAKDSRWASTARSHGDFDDDPATVRSTLARILQRKEEAPQMEFQHSDASLREKRIQLDALTG